MSRRARGFDEEDEEAGSDGARGEAFSAAGPGGADSGAGTTAASGSGEAPAPKLTGEAAELVAFIRAAGKSPDRRQQRLQALTNLMAKHPFALAKAMTAACGL